MTRVKAILFVALQYLLPRYLLTGLGYRVTRIRNTAIKNFLIRRFVSFYGVDVDETARPVPSGYASFNDFFTRELRADARPVEGGTQSIVSPVDGTVSACGTIDDRRVYQAKGLDYTLDDLLAVNVDDAGALAGGSFATIYLAPYDYHRVHAPVAGTLAELFYVPGDLFSVNAATVARIPRLFARNERLVGRLETPGGTMFVLMIGALNVGSMTTPWTGEIRPRRKGIVERLDLGGAATGLDRGDLLGWFNMGSTVILLCPPGYARWSDTLAAGSRVRTGEAIGRLPTVA